MLRDRRLALMQLSVGDDQWVVPCPVTVAPSPLALCVLQLGPVWRCFGLSEAFMLGRVSLDVWQSDAWQAQLQGPPHTPPALD